MSPDSSSSSRILRISGFGTISHVTVKRGAFEHKRALLPATVSVPIRPLSRKGVVRVEKELY